MIDAHAHLTDDKIAGDLDSVLTHAVTAGLTRILTCGEDLESSEAAVAVAKRSPIVRAAVGIHPHRAATASAAAIEHLRRLSREPTVVAIGEIGIDLSGRSAPQVDQERAFTAQLALAAEVGLPVCIHVRDAGAVVRAILRRTGPVRGMVHCYSEGAEQVSEWIDLGLYISFAGTATFPSADAIRAAAALVPEDRLLIETDAPYLAPQLHRGRRNEPAFIAATYEAVAKARGVGVGGLADRVRENAASLFGDRW